VSEFGNAATLVDDISDGLSGLLLNWFDYFGKGDEDVAFHVTEDAP
jgi:hypothetical protein